MECRILDNEGESGIWIEKDRVKWDLDRKGYGEGRMWIEKDREGVGERE